MSSEAPLRSAMIRYAAELPYTKPPLSKRNWGHPLHSLCSYQGKLKPALAATLLDWAVPKGASVLDPLGGVGTVAFEGAMAGRFTVSNDLSPLPSIVAEGKLDPPLLNDALREIDHLCADIDAVNLTSADYVAAQFGLNGRVQDYYHPDTLRVILKARKLLARRAERSSCEAFVWACFLHILHGNRPYALSRHSHPVTPFSPSGPYVRKDVRTSLREKAGRALGVSLSDHFVAGKSLRGDFRDLPRRLPDEPDAIVTSPPFLGMRFDRPNWLRLWFCGWQAETFHATKVNGFLERAQVGGMDCYRDFLRVCAELLGSGQPLIVHVGSGSKGNMSVGFKRLARDAFVVEADVIEDVAALERHGVSDKKQTTRHHLIAFSRR